MRPPCFHSAFTLLPPVLPPCFHPVPRRLLVLVPQLEADFALFEQVGAAVSTAARHARRVISRTDRQTRGLSRPAPAPRLRLRSASTLRPPPSAPPPQLHLMRRLGGMPGTCVYGRDGRTPSISISISPRSPLDLPLDLRREINAELQVQACHPNAKAAARRCPVALFQFFTDSPDLYVDGNLADAFK